MERRRVGRTDLELSVVGLGTAQLVMMPRRDAVAALARGFTLGANWVHSAPDYGEVEPWIADAIAASGRDVHVLAQGPGPLSMLEPYFEHTRRLFRRDRLALYGLGCVDDLERIGENVWGAGGMVELLLEKKRAGQLGGIFCTTHGSAEYVTKLIRSGVFDAIMLAMNPVGFHLLTYNPPAEEGRTFEHIPDVRSQVLPVAVEHGVSILAMKALGGGLLSRGRAFPPHEWLASPAAPIAAGDLLKYALAEPGVCAVVAGCASLEEVEENVRAGHAPIELTSARRQLVERSAARMRLTLCSRCGACESSCSRSLPISFMFRDAYIWNYRTEAFMADDRFDYFRLHPDTALACATCVDRTCLCPQGLDVPQALTRVHANVHQLVAAGHRPGPAEQVHTAEGNGNGSVRVLSHDVPELMAAGTHAVARFVVENTSDAMWLAPQYARRKADALGVAVSIEGRIAGRAPLRTNVSPGQRSMLVVELRAPLAEGTHDVEVALAPMTRSLDPSRKTKLHRGVLRVEARKEGVAIRRAARKGARIARHVLARARQTRAVATDRAIDGRRGRAVEYVDHSIPTRLRAGVTGGYHVTLQNRGWRTWRAHALDGRATEVVVSIDDVTYAVLALPCAEVAPDAQVTLHFALKAPLPEGRHRIQIDLVERPGLRFSLDGATPLTIDIEVERAAVTASTPFSEIALAHNLWYFQPTSGIQQATDGRTYPLFVAKSKGCHVWDPEGRQYIDYTMSWGATILGHADDRIQAAIRDKLDSGALPPFPDPLEMTVTEMLIEDFPSAEMVVFGKNGSDACTVAARLARLATGKQTILSCGFHGWQDFALDHFSFAESGIPDRPGAVFHKFGFNDRDDFFRLFNAHRDDLAAVMIEPAGPFGGPERGMGGDADAAFLGEIAEAARGAKALVIFDEIITGYRYPQNSVQKATGVVPDLTCLGKALASGMPLSAVAGAARIFHTAFARTHYCPTFKGEVYSFAAARAAIEIYRAEPVIDHIWRHGEQLRDGIHRLARDIGIAVECKGPPFRMGVFFPGDPERRRQKRTLFMQELLKGGVITVTGVLLPSYAHDAAVMARTLDVIGAALEVVAWADGAGAYDRLVEIPLL
jgi:glutamate-1-semialdehyde 2,1-aminomutase